MKMSDIMRRTGRLLFPPHCAACRRLLPFDGEGGEKVLCRDCRGGWETAKLRLCPSCGEPMLDCRCIPEALTDSGCSGLVRLTGYDPGDSLGTVNRIVNNIKRCNDADTFDFLARQTIPEIKGRLTGKEPELLMTFCPRSGSAKRVNGFDQSEKLARRLAAYCGCDFAPLFSRRRFVRVKKQKKLSGAERMVNAGRTLLLKKPEATAGRYVILVDDVVTTGATMAVCVSLLRDAGAVGVLCVCVASATRAYGKQGQV